MFNFKSFESQNNLSISLIKVLKDHLEKSNNIMLSGGSTPIKIYKKLSLDYKNMKSNSHIFLSDERYVKTTSNYSNAFNIYPYFNAIIPSKKILQINTNQNIELSVLNYEKKIKSLNNIELGLLGIGADGHTAGIFSNSDKIIHTNKLVLEDLRPDGMKSITVSRILIHKIKKIILITSGESKKPILRVLKDKPNSIIAGLVLKNHPNVEVWHDCDFDN